MIKLNLEAHVHKFFLRQIKVEILKRPMRIRTESILLFEYTLFHVAVCEFVVELHGCGEL